MKNIIFACIILSTSLFTTTIYADGENQTARYLSPNGIDQGDCSSRVTPCASVKYVIGKAAKADPVYMAGGNYNISAEEVVHFTGDKVPLLPGYNRRDLFNTKSIELNPVTLVGVPHYFRQELQAKGFKILSDTKGSSQDDQSSAKDFTQAFIQSSRKNNPATLCTAGMAGNFPCANIDLQAQLSLNNMSSNPSSGSDIWGHVDLNNNREYAIMGLRNGTIIVDVTDPENPSEVGTISGVSSTWRDIKVYQYNDGTEYKAYAYITTEGPQGLQIIDLNNLPNGVSLAATINEFSTAHNVYISNVDYSTNTALAGMDAYLYIAGSNRNNGAYRIFNLSDPVAPQLVTSPPASTGYVHDATSVVIDDARTSQCAAGHNPCEVFIDYNESSVDLWDTTDKASPVLLSTTPYSGSQYTHSGWYSADKNFVYIQDELDEQRDVINTRMLVLDISNLAAPTIVNEYTGATRAIDHNGFAKGDKYYMSNYRRGLTVLDLSNPANPTEFGFFDTLPAPALNSASFDGAWGTYPYLPSGNILVSDINNGLFVLKESASPTPLVGSLAFTRSATAVEENVGNINISVSRLGGDSGEVSIDYSTSGGGATAGDDYTQANGTLTWLDGDTTDKTITIEIIDDTAEESNEQFNVFLSNPSNNAMLGTSILTVTIRSNDIAPTNPPTQSSGGGGSFGIYMLGLLFGFKLIRQRRRLT